MNMISIGKGLEKIRSLTHDVAASIENGADDDTVRDPLLQIENIAKLIEELICPNDPEQLEGFLAEAIGGDDVEDGQDSGAT